MLHRSRSGSRRTIDFNSSRRGTDRGASRSRPRTRRFRGSSTPFCLAGTEDLARSFHQKSCGRPPGTRAASRAGRRKSFVSPTILRIRKGAGSEILIRCQDQTPINAGTGDLQDLAIETALARRFVVISGGLGTGKTTTVLRILQHLVSQSGDEKLRIAHPPSSIASQKLTGELTV
jgi:type IV secretory pathway ATPase VirB11/archaellum biosynthesis ATPase